MLFDFWGCTLQLVGDGLDHKCQNQWEMMFNRKNGIVRHNQKLVYKMCKQSEITVFLENLNMSKKSCGFYEKYSNLWKKKKERKIEILKKFKKYFREDKKNVLKKKKKKII